MRDDRRVVGAVLGGALLLFVEIRFEHREVLGETWVAWLPLAYAALLLTVGAVALWRFDRGGRRLLRALFAASVALGCLGVWFHSGGHPLRSALRVVSAFTLEPGKDGGIKMGSAPPPFAPAAFCGLGIIGLIACPARDRRALLGAGSSLARLPASANGPAPSAGSLP